MKIDIEAIAPALQLDATKFLADFKDGEGWISEEEATERVKSVIAEKFKAAKDVARKQGRKELDDKYSRIIKNSGFENPDGLEGEAKFAAFIEWKDEQAQHIDGDPSKLSQQELLKQPAVKSIISEVTAKERERFATEKAEWEKKVKAAENTRKGILLEKNLLSILEKGKVNLGETPEQKALRLDFLKSRVNLDRVEIGDGDALKFLGEDGYEADFEKEFLPIAQTAFGVVTQDKNKGGSGAQGSGTGGDNGKHTPTYTFATEADFSNSMLKETDPAKRGAMANDWLEQQKKAAGNAG